MKPFFVWTGGIALFAFAAFAQIPAAEDLETKAKRELFQEGLEMREVRESSAKDVGEALSRLEGLWKLRKGGIANDIVLRGFQGGDLNTLIDGIRIYGACPGHMDPAAFHVDFAEVERVEVTKGAFDLANQGSLGGSVNIIRKRSSPGLHFSPSLQWSSFGFINPSINASAGNERFEVQGGYSYRESQPFRDGRGARVTSIGGYRPNFIDDDAFRINTAWGQVRFSPAANQSGELSYTRQDGANILYPYLMMDSPYDIADRLSARYEFRELGPGFERIRIDAYYTAVNHWMTDEKRLSSLTARDVFSMATFARTRASGGRSDIFLRQGWTLGFETYQRNWNAVNSMRSAMMVIDQSIIPNVNTTVAGAYADWKRNLTDRLRIGAGLRLDTAHMEVRKPDPELSLYRAYKGVDGLTHRDTNPSGQVHVSFGLTNSIEIFAGAASTVRVPDAQERYFSQRRMGSDWVGNPALRPVRNAEVNLGAAYRRRAFYIKPAMFYSRLSDLIVIHNQRRRSMVPGVMNPMARSYENIDARQYGGEITYGAPMGTRWLISGGASYVRGGKDVNPELGIFNSNLPEIPPLRARTAVRYGTRRWFAEAEGIATRTQRRVDTDLRETPTPGYGTANLKAGLHAWKVNITAGIDNLLDRYYLEHLSFQRDPFRNGARLPEPGRLVYLNIGYAF
jgi:iron complex outermembrane recepter protein